MKKLLAVILLACLSVGLAACGETPVPPTDSVSAPVTDTSQESSTQLPTSDSQASAGTEDPAVDLPDYVMTQTEIFILARENAVPSEVQPPPPPENPEDILIGGFPNVEWLDTLPEGLLETVALDLTQGPYAIYFAFYPQSRKLVVLLYGSEKSPDGVDMIEYDGTCLLVLTVPYEDVRTLMEQSYWEGSVDSFRRMYWIDYLTFGSGLGARYKEFPLVLPEEIDGACYGFWSPYDGRFVVFPREVIGDRLRLIDKVLGRYGLPDESMY